jgi:hypothetical protein
LDAGPGLRWEKLVLGGFEWALAARTLVSRYVVALRFEAVLDGASVRSVLAAAVDAVEGVRPAAKHSLFLVLSEEVGALDRVRVRCADFAAASEGRKATIVLVQPGHAGALLCTPRPRDGRIRRLLETVGA